MKNPTFCVVTPSFNQAYFLEETIKSVLSQKGDFYIDYMIMDGGSSDNSVEIIKKYDKLLNEGKWNVRCLGIKYNWVNEKDQGQADAIERGFAFTKGEIGIWINSDDTFYSGTVFETVANYFNADDADMIIGNGITMDREGRKLWDYQTERINLKELIFLDYHILQHAGFLKMSYYQNNPFDKNLHYTFDVDFFIRLLRNGIKYKKIPDKLACFRLYDECKTMSGIDKLVNEYMIIVKKVTNNKLLLLATWIYKYLSVNIASRYSRSKIIKKVFSPFRNIFYLMIIGNWGRK